MLILCPRTGVGCLFSVCHVYMQCVYLMPQGSTLKEDEDNDNDRNRWIRSEQLHAGGVVVAIVAIGGMGDLFLY